MSGLSDASGRTTDEEGQLIAATVWLLITGGEAEPIDGAWISRHLVCDLTLVGFFAEEPDLLPTPPYIPRPYLLSVKSRKHRVLDVVFIPKGPRVTLTWRPGRWQQELLEAAESGGSDGGLR